MTPTPNRQRGLDGLTDRACTAVRELIARGDLDNFTQAAVACQRDGTTALPRAWDHLEV